MFNLMSNAPSIEYQKPQYIDLLTKLSSASEWDFTETENNFLVALVEHDKQKQQDSDDSEFDDDEILQIT